MKVLFTTFDALGHVITMIPLASALRDRGHDVRWATGALGCGTVEKAGFPAFRAGMDSPGPKNQYEARYADEISALGTQEARRAHIFPRMFAGIAAAPMLADLAPIVAEWKPDLVIHEAGEFAGPIAAAAAGIPHVTHGFGSLVPRQLVADAGEVVAALWRSAGLEPRPYGGSYDHLYIDIYPPLLQSGEISHVGARQLLRPADVSSRPHPPREPGQPPFIYATFGTVVNQSPAFQAVVDAMRAVEARVLVTVGSNGNPEVFGKLPEHITVERFVPQAQILPECDLVVSHGGSGTLLGALSLGIPALGLPQMADQFVNSDACAAAGAGLVLRPDEADQASIEAAVRRLLGEPAFREAAGRVADDIEAMPSPAVVAELLERKFSPN